MSERQENRILFLLLPELDVVLFLCLDFVEGPVLCLVLLKSPIFYQLSHLFILIYLLSKTLSRKQHI